MFPASAGMNRDISISVYHVVDVPRERGDELRLMSDMFPASAGMNRPLE